MEVTAGYLGHFELAISFSNLLGHVVELAFVFVHDSAGALAIVAEHHDVVRFWMLVLGRIVALPFFLFFLVDLPRFALFVVWCALLTLAPLRGSDYGRVVQLRRLVEHSLGTVLVRVSSATFLELDFLLLLVWLLLIVLPCALVLPRLDLEGWLVLYLTWKI